VELLTASTASPQTSAEREVSTVTAVADLLSLARGEIDFPLTEPFHLLLAKVLESELCTKATFSELQRCPVPNVVTIEPSSLIGDPQDSVADSESRGEGLGIGAFFR